MQPERQIGISLSEAIDLLQSICISFFKPCCLKYTFVPSMPEREASLLLWTLIAVQHTRVWDWKSDDGPAASWTPVQPRGPLCHTWTSKTWPPCLPLLYFLLESRLAWNEPGPYCRSIWDKTFTVRFKHLSTGNFKWAVDHDAEIRTCCGYGPPWLCQLEKPQFEEQMVKRPICCQILYMMQILLFQQRKKCLLDERHCMGNTAVLQNASGGVHSARKYVLEMFTSMLLSATIMIQR